ncbi:MAG: transcription termination factor Rho [Atopobiaceae bacterium]|nr:transcription termination factor Rho [Atopobiaceae bacterium]
MAEETNEQQQELEQTSAPTAEEAPKRRRTRTRKVAEAPAEEQAAEQAGEEAPKRRRTRARKAEAQPEEGAVAAEGAAEEAPKKRRTRTRKAETAASEGAEGAGEGVAEQAPAEQAPAEQVAPEEAPKRRRGRPRKSEVAAAAEAALTGEAPAPQEGTPAPAESVSEAQMSIEEMTRATQAATQASAVPLGAPATTLAEADAQQAEAAPGQGRRRRRNGGDAAQQQGGSANASSGNGGNQNNGNGGNNNRRNNQNRRRNRRNQQEQAVEPTLTRDELAQMKVADLRIKAAELGVDYAGVRKKDLAEAIFEAAALAEGFRPVSGVLEIQNEGYGFLRTGNYMAGDNDAFVHQQIIRQHALRTGDKIVGSLAPSRSGNKYPPLHHIDSVNGRPVEEMRNRPRFRDLTPIYPDQRLVMEHGADSITGRAIDLVAPIGKGQRGLIVSPPKAGKTTVLKRICQSIAANNPEVHLFCLLVDERPEEVTDMERSIRGEVVASTFDMPADNHTKVSELVIEHAKRLVELGEDVVVVLDSITRLARAYNLAQPASGRILSGGVDSAALYPPKKFLGAARNIENGGSLTILASALVDTGSKMDEVIFEEFKGTGNMELKLDRDLADKRIFPAIDPVASGTRNEDLLIEAELQPFVWGIRRILANMNNTERAANALVKGVKSTMDNQEFLIRSARKAQQSDIML